MAMYGATIGRVGILGVPATVNQACCVLFEPTTVLAGFVFYWFWAHRTEIAAMGEGGGQPNISQNLVRSLRIPAPTLEEQRIIVGRIEKEREATEGLLAELGRQVELLREHRQAIVTAAVTGQLVVTRRAA